MELDNAPSKSNDYLNRLEVDGEEEYIDRWDTGELLFLASSVLRSDRNWVSVARSIKPFGEQTRPADWYTPKNCALQYTKLLNEIEEDSKKKTLPRTERETSEVMLVKNLTDKRLNELAWLNQQNKVTSNVLKTYIEMVESGDFDDHLDDLLKQIEEKEKNEEENYNEYLQKRETLNATKKLNKSRITKAKAAIAKVIESKKKVPSYSEISEESPHHATVEEVIKNIKRELDSEEDALSSKLASMRSEIDAPITLNALLDSKVTIPSSVAPTSPLLTSLLRSIGSSTPSSHTLSSVSSHLKEGDSADASDSVKMEIDVSKSREISPRSSVPQSPRPTPASSPLLNSLLKNSPSSTTTIQMSPGKEMSPKAVSSPPTFFNPSSVLASAAAQQIALATSTHPHPFFQHLDSADARKVSLQTSPVTSACLSAPTLSKLLEMPPSAPGRLPLPVLDSPPTPTVTVVTAAPAATTQVPTVLQTPEAAAADAAAQQAPAEPSKTSTPAKADPEAAFPTDTTVLQKSLASYSQLDKKGAAAVAAAAATPAGEGGDAEVEEEEEDVEEKPQLSFDPEGSGSGSNPCANIDILEAVSESINQAFESKEITKKVAGGDEVKKAEEDEEGNPSPLKIEIIAMEEEVESYIIADELIKSGLTSGSDEFSLPLTDSSALKSADASEEVEKDEKSLAGRKFYKSRSISKKEESPETPDSLPLFQSPKKVSCIQDSESPTPSFANSTISSSLTQDLSDSEKQESKSGRRSDSKSPVSKKPRLLEKSSTDKAELSEDEAPQVAVRRSGRRGKKGRGRIARNTPVKQIESRDQYEFTESTEENSLGCQMSDTLCYMPRVKDEETKLKDSEDAASTAGSSVEKKAGTPTRAKQGRGGSHANAARKSLFTSDEERMSDSMTSDDASNHLLSEDKLKKWEESCDKKGDAAKSSGETNKQASKTSDALKKKPVPIKKNTSGKTVPTNKERKSSTVDMEELSMGSRDSEDISLQEKDSAGDKEPSVVDMEVETNDSHPSSSTAAESDKQLDDPEGSESLQGSAATDFSPPPPSDATPHFGKQDWFQGGSPKSSEAVSQSSEESEEYESDNWDNHSASTNKSTSLSTGAPSRTKRKERESPQYKAWKKAISIVWREASCHKNANIFSQKVTNDVAPGYLSIVHRPMDLSQIKRNIDSGVIRTTSQFHRDMMLMFMNAIMYNSSDHDVHQMALEMQKDVMQQISAFLATQPTDADEESEPVSTLRGARTAKSQKGLGKESTRASSGKIKEETD